MICLNQNKNKKKTTANTVFFGIKTFNIILICLMVLAGFLYLTQVNAAAVKGYIIRDLEMELEEVRLINHQLELQSQALQSAGFLAVRVQELQMVESEYVEYIQMPGGEVAVAR